MMPLCNTSVEDEDELSAQFVDSSSPKLILSTIQYWSIPLREKTEENKKCNSLIIYKSINMFAFYFEIAIQIIQE